MDQLPPQGGLLGRGEDCACCIGGQDLDVSRHHAQIWLDQGVYWVRDLGTTNGSTLDGRGIAGAERLRNGAVLGLGAVVSLRFVCDDRDGDHLARGHRSGAKDKAGPQDWRPYRARIMTLAAFLGIGLLTLGWGLWRWMDDLNERAQLRAQARAELWQRILHGEDVGELERLIAQATAPPVRGLAVDEGPSDPLSQHIQRVLTELTGQAPDQPVDLFFRDAVSAQLPALVDGTRCPCHVERWQEELQEILRAELERVGARADWARWLIYLPWVESCYNPGACSEAAARGLWQFIPKTANRYALVVDDRVDERCDWRKATRAAARYFAFLQKECGLEYPLLAIAAYNTGEARACGLARNEEIPSGRRDFLAFYTHNYLLPETMKYVPKFIAASFADQHPAEAIRLIEEQTGRSPELRTCPDVPAPLPPSQPCPTLQEACPREN